MLGILILYTPGKLERLTQQAWDDSGKLGFPIYLYHQQILEPHWLGVSLADSLTGVSEEVTQQDLPTTQQADASVTKSSDPCRTPLPGIEEEPSTALQPKTLLKCCSCARTVSEAYGLPMGKGEVSIEASQVEEYC